MSIKLLIDMNLSPDWVSVLKTHGWSAVHWSTVGNPRASDDSIMNWAVMNEYVAVTHDLDFGAMLALSHAQGTQCASGSRRRYIAGSSGRLGHRCYQAAR